MAFSVERVFGTSGKKINRDDDDSIMSEGSISRVNSAMSPSSSPTENLVAVKLDAESSHHVPSHDEVHNTPFNATCETVTPPTDSVRLPNSGTRQRMPSHSKEQSGFDF